MTRTRVLLVDDDPAVRRLLRTTLSEEFEIAEAVDGDQGIALAESFRPHLVLLDWQMPGRTGAEVLAELKQANDDVAVIMLTAEREPRYREMAESLGADAFLTKPFSPLELLATVERLVGPPSNADTG